MLTIKDLHAYYGQIEALKGIDISVQEGKIVCLIGSNGAGKTTLLNAISRMIHTEGSIKWNDTELTTMSPQKVAKFGIMHVPSGRHVFPGLSVRDNLELGTVSWRGAFGRGKYDEDIEKVFELFPRLKERENQLAWSMSGGEQQMLAVGRAMMGRPKILLLDEPSMGLAPVVVNELFEKIVEINKTGMTILLVEQNAKIALKNSDYAYVIEQGSYHSEVIDMLSNNLAVVDEPSGKGSGNEVDMEQILNWNPDVILFAPGSIYATVGEDAAWQGVTAIQNGAYYEVPIGPYNWMGFPPSVQRLLGMLWMAKVLYPDAADYDLYTEAANYFQLFYHCDLTQEQYDALVANSLPQLDAAA